MVMKRQPLSSVVIGRLMTLELPYQQPHLTSMPLCWLGS